MFLLTVYNRFNHEVVADCCFLWVVPLSNCITLYTAAVIVARKEAWRRREIWKRVKEFQILTGIPIASPIISLIVGSEKKALEASRSVVLSNQVFCCFPRKTLINVFVRNRYLLESGFHVTAIRPPTVPPNSCRSTYSSQCFVNTFNHLETEGICCSSFHNRIF